MKAKIRTLALAAAALASACGSYTFGQPLARDMRCIDLLPEMTEVEKQGFVEALDSWSWDLPPITVTYGDGGCENHLRVGLLPEQMRREKKPRATTVTEIEIDGRRGPSWIGLNPEQRAEDWDDLCWVRETFAHEIGHFFGFWEHVHQDDDPDSIMVKKLYECTDRVPTERDIKLVLEIYK